MSQERSVSLIGCFVSASLAFFVIPLFMIGNSPLDFQFISYSVFFKTSGLFSLFFGLLLSAIFLGLNQIGARTVAVIFVRFSIAWVFMAGFFLPVSELTSMVDPETNPINEFNAILAFLASLLLVTASFTQAQKILNVFMTVVVLVSVIQSVLNIQSAHVSIDSVKNVEGFELSSEKNILVISFDGVPGGTINSLIRDNAAYAKRLKDFEIFENAVSQSPATEASMLGELFGVRDYKSMGETVSDVKKSLDEQKISQQQLLRRIAASYQYGYSDWGRSLRIENSVALQQIFSFEFFRYAIVRIWTRLAFKLVDWKASTSTIRQYMTDIPAADDQVLFDHVQSSQGPSWDKRGSLQILDFDGFAAGLSVVKKPLSIRYLHFIFTHFPVDFDRDCNYRSFDLAWFNSNQNRAGILEENRCVLKKMFTLLDKLESMGVYDNSLIVFKSDHGKPVSYYASAPYDLSVNGSTLWGYDRYRPMLMIKDIARTGVEVSYRSELVLLNDLARTLCHSASTDGYNATTDLDHCEEIPGQNLLASDPIQGSHYYLYTVKDPSADSHDYDHHISVKIDSRSTSLLDAMLSSPEISLSPLPMAPDS